MVLQFLNPPRLVTNPLVVTVISRVLLIAADLTVIAVTWFTTYATVRMTRAAFPQRQMGVSSLLLRDGSVYFM